MTRVNSQWDAETMFFLALKKWITTLPENYFKSRSESDMFKDFGDWLVANKGDAREILHFVVTTA